ncbi:MAG: ATP-binding protein [Campylobacterota bacterium]|nr:ATP-binding protein [Campylobacterota bacterium]
MKTKRFKSTIFNSLILFAIVPLLIFGIIGGYAVFKFQEKSIEHQHAQILKEIHAQTNEIIERIETLGKFLQKQNHITNNALNILMQTHENISNILILNAKGLVTNYTLNKNNHIFVGYDYSNMPFFTNITADKKNYWSKTYLSNIDNHPAMSYSIKLNPDQIAIFIVNLKSLNLFAKKFVNKQNVPLARFIDDEGTFIAHPILPNMVQERQSVKGKSVYENLILKQKPYTLFYFNNLKNEKSIGMIATTKLGWTIIIRESQDFVFSLFKTSAILFIVFLLFLILLSIILSYRLSNSIFKPLNDIEETVTQIAQGNYNKELTFTPYKEINGLIEDVIVLQNNIKQHTTQLHQLNDTLQEKVDKKTHELVELNSNLELRIKDEVEKNKKQEKILFEQSKMASMGEMIGNIAHQWRQPLSVISTSASGMKLQKELGVLNDTLMNEAIQGIMTSTKYLSDTIDDFRNFFKKSKYKEPLKINDLIQQSTSLLHSTLTQNNIQLIIEDFDKELVIEGYFNELMQAVMNIVSNAKDALKDVEQQDEKLVIISISKNQDSVIISIKDNAGGIPEEILSKIFEPYFTTKHQSQGTGIGLYMSQQIVVNHMNGKLQVQNSSYTYKNNTYHGAVFELTLPYD